MDQGGEREKRRIKEKKRREGYKRRRDTIKQDRTCVGILYHK